MREFAKYKFSDLEKPKHFIRLTEPFNQMVGILSNIICGLNITVIENLSIKLIVPPQGDLHRANAQLCSMTTYYINQLIWEILLVKLIGRESFYFCLILCKIGTMLENMEEDYYFEKIAKQQLLGFKAWTT